MPSQDALDIHPTEQLSDVTLSALQLHRQPFSDGVPDTLTFVDDTSSEQLTDVKQALITGDDLLLILGEHGAGKSVLLHQLGANSGQRIQCFAVKGSPRFSTLNLFAGMLEAFKRKPPEKLKDILDDLIPCLQTMVARNTLSAIVLDDAEQVSESELTQLLSGMLYINGQEETLMRVALAAPPEFEDRIPDLLPEGADLPYSSLTIDGMNATRAANYLAFRLQGAGFTGELPFTDHDIKQMLSQSGGLPTGLHAAAAGLLNEQFDPSAMDCIEQPDLYMDDAEPFLQSRKGKFGLGLLAIALILIGLTMFMPDAANEQERFGSTDESTPEDLLGDAEPLRIVEERKLVPLPPEPVESSVQTTLPAAGQSDDAADITINGADDADEDLLQATDSLNQEETVQNDATADDTADSDATGNLAASTAGLVERPAADSSAELATPPVVIVPERETQDTDPSADSGTTAPLPNAETAGLSTETSTSDSDERPAADDVSLNSTPAAETAVTEPTLPISSTPDVNPAVADILESPTWILVQDPEQITVQMSASRDRKSIESFLQRNRNILAPPNSIYSFQRNGETWYALLHGLFPGFEAAQAAVEQMPASALTDQPWIRNVGRIQTVLKAQ